MNALRKLIKRHEGLSLIPYKCPAGFKSIGWGWNVDSHPLPPDINAHLKARGSITKTMCEELLDLAIQRSINDCRRLYPKYDTFSENRRNALADMMYNMGLTTLSKFRISNRFVNDEMWQEAADNFAMSKWAKQVKGRATEVLEMLRKG
jgi:lysozyme